MRPRWHKWLLAALLGSACSLNPQPDLPMSPVGDSAGNGTASGGTSSISGGSTGIVVGGSGTVGAGGSGPITTPADAGPGQGGDTGIGGEAGESGIGGAAGEAGATSNASEASAR